MRTGLRVVAGIAALVLIMGVRSAGSEEETKVSDDVQQVERRMDIPYSKEGTDRRLIDVFFPGENVNGCCIFFVHGGGWSGGKKEGWHPVMEHFAGLGYVCTSAEYHLAPDHVFPKQVEDLRNAMSFVKSRADEYGFSPDRVAVMGSSAGAHLAAMLATIQPEDDLGMTPEVTVRDTLPQAAVCLCSVMTCHDDDKLRDTINQFLGATEEENPELFSQASPVDRVCGKEPPFLMVVGDADDVTPISQHEAMRDALVAKGGSAEVVILPGVKHGFGYGVTSDAQKKTVVLVERFLAEVFGLK
jgi:acetyl esterase/lipase